MCTLGESRCRKEWYRRWVLKDTVMSQSGHPLSGSLDVSLMFAHRQINCRAILNGSLRLPMHVEVHVNVVQRIYFVSRASYNKLAFPVFPTIPTRHWTVECTYISWTGETVKLLTGSTMFSFSSQPCNISLYASLTYLPARHSRWKTCTQIITKPLALALLITTCFFCCIKNFWIELATFYLNHA